MIIDLHAHYVPRSFLEVIEKDGAPHGASLRWDGKDPTILVGGRPYGPITRHYYEATPRLADMDKSGVDMQVLSLNPPMVYWADADLGTRLARLYNDELKLVEEDPEEGRRYQIYGFEPSFEDEEGSDLSAIARGWISVTPVHFDLTDRPGLERLRSWDLGRMLEAARAASSDSGDAEATGTGTAGGASARR